MPVVVKRVSQVAVLFLALLALGSFGVMQAQGWVDERLTAADSAGARVLVGISPGSSMRDVAVVLHAKGLIKDPLVFRYYARYRKLDASMQSGEYELSAAMTPEQILQKLAAGDVVVYRFTVPEGLTVTQVAELLAQKGLAKKERFLELASQSKAAAGHVGDAQVRQPLEGYLFPSTYNYRPGATEEELLAMMFDGFVRIWTPDLQKRAAELKWTVHEVLTLASIIEEEAQAAKERAKISGVYHNRLRVGMKLDADPTVRYALDKPPQQDLLYQDLEVKSPYNTYRVAGLPPGPIAAPGLASVKAALYPEQHDFWYFVAKEDGTGEHYFAETLEAHDENTAKAAANARQ